ncbi:HlyD family type I secretion periplasmic adaptor subunit [Gimibacter soli]|uniref:Membrane fusion protein (MFP) family protein n=1 Tax=Gimibacter soli TaxID=3024400 RepID=A0AAE9XQC7_9PROT|nr:HlyD family type I secretion periplasmic adaptor subunit [Gimibacter soli]WCL53166.1 HlyD family type I secretion periplasmic adaptor subunit [Gimibacter soli]
MTDVPHGQMSALIEEVRQSRFPFVEDKVRIGAVTILAFFGFLLAWSIFAPLSTGAVVTGRVIVEGDKETLQHLEGGIVREILVKNGDKVLAGDPLLVMDPRPAEARVAEVKARQLAFAAQRNRLQAELDGLDAPDFSNLDTTGLNDAAVADILAAEERQFVMRRSLYARQEAAYVNAVTAAQEVYDNTSAQLQNIAGQLKLLDEEISDVDGLLAKGYAPKSRSLALKRAREGAASEQLGLMSQQEQQGQALLATRVELDKFRSERAQEIAKTIQAATVDLVALNAAVRLAEDQRSRAVMRAPRNGTVMNMKVNTVGGVLPAAAAAMELVPEGAQLVVTGQLQAKDAANIGPGLHARISVLAFKSRSTPTIEGKVLTVSPDIVKDERTGTDYYPITIGFDASSLANLEQGETLQPGYPVQVIVETAKQPVLLYLLQPLLSNFTNAFHER